MNARRELHQFDFRRGSGLPTNVERYLRDWERNFCAIASENWAEYLRSHLVMEPLERQLQVMLATRDQFSDATLAYRCVLGENGPTTLFAFPRRVAMALISDVLGEPLDNLPEDRELTAAEQTLWDLLMEELSRALGEAWPEQQLLDCRLQGTEPKPQRTRLYPLSEKVLFSRLALKSSFGAQDFSWVVPRQALEELISAHHADAQDRRTTSHQVPETVARGLPAELVVNLGKARLDVAELANLHVGDVVTLDQRISDPLVASVSGSPKFLVWAGRVGSHRAFQIKSLL
jgi:flagellar motor switch protein FliM